MLYFCTHWTFSASVIYIKRIRWYSVFSSAIITHNCKIAYQHNTIPPHIVFSFLTSLPVIKPLPTAHHGEVCDLSKRFLIFSSSVGGSRSQYITVPYLFTDAFLSSLSPSTSGRQSLRRLCCRRCQTAGTYPAAAVTAASQYSPKR